MAKTVHVLGGGSLGTLWAAHLMRSGTPTTLLVRPGTLAARGRSVLARVTCSWEERPTEARLAAEPSSGAGPPISTLVLATKAFAAGAALEGVLPRLADEATVVLLCNGALAVSETLSTAQLPRGATVLAATTTHGAWLKGPELDDPPDLRHVVHAGNGQTWVGPLLARGVDASANDATSERARAAACAFGSGGLGAQVEDELQTQRRLWLKLAANAVLNPLTALWNVRNGGVLARYPPYAGNANNTNSLIPKAASHAHIPRIPSLSPLKH